MKMVQRCMRDGLEWAHKGGEGADLNFFIAPLIVYRPFIHLLFGILKIVIFFHRKA